MNAWPISLRRCGPLPPARGMTLVVVLLLLVVMGLTATVAMRSAITQEKWVNNYRAESAAQYQAEFALHYCESELLKPSGSRVVAFQAVESLPVRTLGSLKWPDSTAWVTPAAGVSPVAAYLALDLAQAQGATVPPDCLVERLQLRDDGEEVWVATARGFSADYTPGAGAGQQLSGSVVWLQSFLYFE